MADPERAAKRVSHWTNNELPAFNIRVEDAGVETFFNIPQLPPPTVSTTILDNLDEPPGLCSRRMVYSSLINAQQNAIPPRLILLCSFWIS